jgi:hypothetical protein
MRDIKELIYAAVEENAVQFQELVNAQLQVRAYDAIESLRPEIGASMFGESSHKKMDDEDEEEIEDEDEKKSEVDEELKGNQHKIDKNKNGKIDAHDFKLLRKEEVEQIDEGPFKGVGKMMMKRKLKKGEADSMKKAETAYFDHDDQDEFMAHMADRRKKEKALNRLTREEVEQVDEVAMPQNQADWQALITHQIKTAGHPVATDAQFRATHGKDTSKIASQEPPEDKMNYAAAQGGTVKQ